MSDVYSARDVAEIVGLSESRVRYWAQTGFVGPSEKVGGRPVYNFQDLVGVRAAKELLERGISLQRARKGIEALKAQLPHLTRPLAQVRVISDGDRLLVTDGAAFEPLSRQLVMDFAVADLAGRVAEVLRFGERPSEREAGANSAYSWFLEGLRLDGDTATAGGDDQSGEARAAYEKALASDPRLAAAHTNLGTLLGQHGELTEARAHYETALAIDPEQPEARYNLANLLDDLGESELAIGEWLRVVTACPEFADAHYNLARVFATRGARDRARFHAESYLALDGQSEWATRVQALLADLD